MVCVYIYIYMSYVGRVFFNAIYIFIYSAARVSVVLLRAQTMVSLRIARVITHTCTRAQCVVRLRYSGVRGVGII